jgi:uncharacterized protein YbaR (Trm112 family)
MNRSLVELLQCAHCRRPFELDEQTADSQSIDTGTLHCRECGVVVPIEQGFPFFTLADVAQADPQSLLGTPDEYDLYRQRKFQRGEIEMYAAFHPFNESLRAGEPLLPLFSRNLKTGDVILEPWARTGWTAVWLASQFPEQRIVALWEGATSVLGYRGFAHWFASDRRPQNLDVMFVHPEQDLPFASSSIGAIFSHDCFHRFGVAFASEMLRVAQPSAPIVLAHVHLSNSEPDPWFARGGTIRHGRTYRAWLDRITHGTLREGRVWSESDLFGATQLPSDSPDTSHYNALILVAKDIDEPTMRRPDRSVEKRLLLNPLYQLHGGRSVARIDSRHLGGAVGHMLERHPVYRRRLAEEPLPLSDLDWLIIAAASCGITTDRLPSVLVTEAAYVEDRIDYLCSKEVLLPVPVSASMHDLQRFHANQLPPAKAFLDLNELDPSAGLTGKNFCLSGEEIGQSLKLIASALAGLGAEAGAMLQIGTSDDPVVLLIMLATLALGMDVQIRSDVQGLALKSAHEVRVIELGWEGNPGGFISLVEAAVPHSLPAIADSCICFSASEDGPRIAARHFLEAASSLRHTMARPHTIKGFVRASDWFTATVGLLSGFPVRVG